MSFPLRVVGAIAICAAGYVLTPILLDPDEPPGEIDAPVHTTTLLLVFVAVTLFVKESRWHPLE